MSTDEKSQKTRKEKQKITAKTIIIIIISFSFFSVTNKG